MRRAVSSAQSWSFGSGGWFAALTVITHLFGFLTRGRLWQFPMIRRSLSSRGQPEKYALPIDFAPVRHHNTRRGIPAAGGA